MYGKIPPFLELHGIPLCGCTIVIELFPYRPETLEFFQLLEQGILSSNAAMNNLICHFVHVQLDLQNKSSKDRIYIKKCIFNFDKY